MEHQKRLGLLNEASNSKLKKNETLVMISQMQIMMQETKQSIIWRY